MSTESSYRPLLPLLAGFTVVTGFVDAVSYLKFGHVFVANMTGNIVFLGFAFGGAADISITGSLVALAGFLAGAVLGGRFVTHLFPNRRRLLLVSSGTKILLIGTACIVAAAGSASVAPYIIIALLGISMGVQNALARKLAIPDVTTTVLTMTLTGIAADSSLAGGTNPRLVNRVLAVLTMLAGAFAGAFVVLRYGVPLALLCATCIVIAIFIGALTIRGLEA